MRAVGLLVGVVLLSGGATAYAAPSYVTGTGCTEQQAFVEGDDAAVADLLPGQYEPIRTPSGAPLVFARAIRCDTVASRGDRFPAVLANYGVVIESPDDLGCLSAAPVVGPLQGDALPICNWYTLAWLANDRRAVKWLKARTRGFPAFYDPSMTFDLGEDGKFHFEAAGPSPYAIDARLDDAPPGEKAVRGGYWGETPAGTVKVVASSNELVAGGAEGSVSAAPGSDLAALMGSGEEGYAPGYSDFSAIGIRRGSYRKQRLYTGRRVQRFDGSCTLEGDSAFSPVLTNAVAQARYAYTGAGTCSGKLNGQKVSDAPVTLRHSGPVEASCEQAHTTYAGRGVLTFESGEAIRYTLDFTSTVTDVDFMFYGRRSGFARGRGSFLTDRTPPDIPQKCGGDGLESAPLDVSFTTDSPLVSRQPRPEASSRSERGQGRPRRYP